MGAIRPSTTVDAVRLIGEIIPSGIGEKDSAATSDSKRSAQRQTVAALAAKAVQVRAGQATFTADEMQQILAGIVLVAVR